MTKQEPYDYLRAHGVDFEITEHPAVFNMEECAAVDVPYPEDDAKNLLVRDDKKRSYYLITVRCGKRVDLKEFQRRHGTRRLSFASPEDMEQYLDCTPGSSSVMGLANDKENKVQLLMDEDVVKGEFLGCHPCINTSSLKLYTKDVLEKFLPAVHHEPVYVVLNGD